MRTRVLGALLALSVVFLLTVPVLANPPQSGQPVSFTPNPIPVHQDCLSGTDVLVQGDKWAGHYKDREVTVYIQYADGSRTLYGIVTVDQSGNWQQRITVWCTAPQLINGALVVDVLLWVHATANETGYWHYYVPASWV
jgi:hypothetical protein